MSAKAATAAGVSELERARGREQAAYLSIRMLAVAVIAFVVITLFQARPAPGGQGEALGVAVGLMVFCGATIAAMWLTQTRSAVQLAVLVMAVVSAAALIGLQGNGAAFLGVFPAVCLAALVLPVRLSALVAGVAAAAVSAAWLWNGHAPIAGIVLVLTTYTDDRSVIDALRAGARGYLTKDASAGEIREALQRVTSGQAAIDPAVQQHLVNAIAMGPSTAAAPQLPAGLTQREAEVLALIAQGLSNIEIAGRLVVSETTVKSHINHLFAKTGVRDRAQAVTYAYQHGLT